MKTKLNPSSKTSNSNLNHHHNYSFPVAMNLQVPQNSRGQAWVSFDGKDREQLSEGDALICHMSAWPVPAACDKESTTDFLRSVREGLHWNLRKRQGTDGHSAN